MPCSKFLKVSQAGPGPDGGCPERTRRDSCRRITAPDAAAAVPAQHAELTGDRTGPAGGHPHLVHRVWLVLADQRVAARDSRHLVAHVGEHHLDSQDWLPAAKRRLPGLVMTGLGHRLSVSAIRQQPATRTRRPLMPVIALRDLVSGPVIGFADPGSVAADDGVRAGFDHAVIDMPGVLVATSAWPPRASRRTSAATSASAHVPEG
jgi:hypothetical protein